MTTLMTRLFRDRCTRCQVGQGRPCQCDGGARVRNGQRNSLPVRRVGFRVPEPVQMLLIYGGSVLVVVVCVVGLWRAFA